MIGILNAYHFDPNPETLHQEEYTSLIIDFVRQAFPKEEIRDYKIAFGDWPRDIDECTLWFITGSPKAAYDLDPWIFQLKKFVLEIDRYKRKLVGICFGHQVIAAALGGEVIKSPLGWGIGIMSFTVGGVEPWMDPPLSNASLLFSHQDQVIRIPPHAKILAFDSFCEIQMFQVGEHILTMQGHPEYTPEFLRKRLEHRRPIIPSGTLNAALESLTRKHDEPIFTQWIRNFAGAIKVQATSLS